MKCGKLVKLYVVYVQVNNLPVIQIKSYELIHSFLFILLNKSKQRQFNILYSIVLQMKYLHTDRTPINISTEVSSVILDSYYFLRLIKLARSLRNCKTIKIASLKIFPDILDCPSTRSSKTIGISFILNPFK